MKKIAVVVGSRGMDASHLIKFLLEKDYQVIGTDRRSSSPNYWRHEELGIRNKFIHEIMDITDFANVCDIINKYKPDELYNLGAMSFVSDSFNSPIATCEINAMGQINILESVRKFSPNTKVYFASTSETFGKVQETPQKETTPFYPRSPYGVSKLFGFWITKNYREAYGLFACSGILFNHEGELRGEEFVTRKITKNIAKVLKGEIESFELGNLDSKRDWGHSQDYVEGMYLMLQQDIPDDFILATGETRTIREFISESFKVLNKEIIFVGSGLNEKIYLVGKDKPIITISDKYFRPSEVDLLQGDNTKAFNVLGWKPKKSFSNLVSGMITADCKREGIVL